MKKYTLLLGAALLVAGAQHYSHPGGMAAAQEDFIAVVNGVTLPVERFSAYVGGQDVPQNDLPTVIDNLIMSEIIAQTAREMGLDKQPEVQQLLAVAEYSVLGQAYVNDYFAKNPIGDAQITARYEEMVKQAEGQLEYNVAHILVDDEALANDLLAQIQADASVFGALAQEHSKDPGSATGGGVLGWVPPQVLVPPFAEAMQALEDGGITAAPVQSNFGWHIIRVDGRRPIAVPPLNDELRQRIQQEESAQVLGKHLQELRSKAEITLPQAPQ